MSGSEQLAPVISIHGRATPEEVAAVVTVLSGLGGPPARPEPVRNRWSDPATLLRLPPVPGPDAWQHSAR